MFASWGSFVYSHRWPMLLASLALLGASIFGASHGGQFKNSRENYGDSTRAFNLTDAEFPQTRTTTSSFSIILGSHSMTADDPAFRSAVDSALADLRVDSRVTSVTTPFTAPPGDASPLVSRDRHEVLATVNLKDSQDVARLYYNELRAKAHSNSLDITATSNVAVQADFDSYLAADLRRAETVSLPLSLILLLLVFGAVIAALLPVGVGVSTILGAVGGVLVLARATDVNQYALNVVTLVGLGVSIDYSLFIVSRFREELGTGASVEAALSRAMATAGRAVTFSGLTVAIGLSGLLFYQATLFTSLGLGGMMAVALAVVYGLTFLPALLAILGTRVNRLRLPWPRGGEGRGFWHQLASAVMRRPILVLVPTVGFILLAGLPFTQIRLTQGDITQLPPSAETRRGGDILRADFANQDRNTVDMVVNFASGDPLSREHVGAVYDLSRRLATLPHIIGVDSIVDTSPSLTRADYQSLYAGPTSSQPAAVKEGLKQTVGQHVVLLSAVIDTSYGSDAARDVVTTIRGLPRPGDGELLVTGVTAYDIDANNFIISRTPLALGYIIVVTYLVLMLLLGSVVLPLKAVVMNLLSLSASFGALVWIFQQGHLSGFLNFTPGSIDPLVPILLFCIVFGLSMDYEVFILTRMKEEYDRTGDNRHAVAEGLERSGRLVTGAAAIMVAVFLAFGLADVKLIKSIGLGMAIAVAIDATVVRALIVPATMRLLGDLNWWAPAPMARLYARLGHREEAALPSPSPASPAETDAV
ncbi:MAG TPA: MMPL family transporter [Candidatus Dormibacteraeota bacterium]|nr:MMPL family transporter [Candidatus Dormibacteraeota bacterium]